MSKKLPPPSRTALGIAEVAARSGVDQRVLRAWESRHGFPSPLRLSNGRRAYAEADVERLRQVSALRETGLSLGAAIARVRETAPAGPSGSIFAGLRMQRPELSAGSMHKPLLVALSRAIEDEYAASADGGVVFGAFQRERHYREAESRWRDVARRAEVCAVFADFAEARAPDRAPIEVPVDPADGISREWCLIFDAPQFSACLLARERPGEAAGNDERLFDTLFSAEPDITRASARTACEIAHGSAPALMTSGEPPQIAGEPGPSSPGLRTLTAMTNRMLAYAERGDTLV